MRNTSGFDEPGVVPVRIDVTDPASIAEAAKLAADTTLLVNNAGIAALIDGPLAADMEAQSARMFDTNYYGVVRVTQAFEPILAARPHAAIINVLSDIVWLPRPYLAPYAASKAAAWSYTNQLRLSLHERGIQILGLHVGFVDTDLTHGIDVPKASPEDVVRQTYDALALGKSEVMADKGHRVAERVRSRPRYPATSRRRQALNAADDTGLARQRDMRCADRRTPPLPVFIERYRCTFA